MKAHVCDPCLTEGKLNKAGWRLRLKKGLESFRLNICSMHKGMKLTYDQALNIGVQAESAFHQMKG